jgi:hypothetical protein
VHERPQRLRTPQEKGLGKQPNQVGNPSDDPAADVGAGWSLANHLDFGSDRED